MKQKWIASVLAAVCGLSVLPAGSAVSAEETAALPAWIPSNFDEALTFDNTYGKNHVQDGLICCVRKERLDKDGYAIDASASTAGYELLMQETFELNIPEKPDESDTEAYEAYLEELANLGLSEYDLDFMNVTFRYEVFVYQPVSEGTLSLQWITGSGISNPNAVMTFDIAADGTITQTDFNAWLPDSNSEWWNFYRTNKGITVHDGYIIFCDQVCTDGGFQLYTYQTGNGCAEPILDYEVIPATTQFVCGDGGNTIMVYKPITPGSVKMTFTEKRSWETEILESVSACFHFGEDGTITEISEKDVSDAFSGDCNDDGNFTVMDIIHMQKYLMGQAALPAWQNADFCPDSRIDGFDLAIMKKRILSK
ncbi:MAG: hypothetical protein IJN57_11690 [Oscillospiraceae bacterium]|nr:hypothetical protein [Oscillospiraceae bacterium]